MKKIIYILLTSMAFLVACEKILDKIPLDMITDAAVWKDQVLCDAYLTGQYADMSVLTKDSRYPSGGGWWNNWDMPYIDIISDECLDGILLGRPWGEFNTADAKMGGWTAASGHRFLDWWEQSYKNIRALNIFIERLPDTPFDEDYKKSRIAEARFLRAYNYYAMVQRYGGVPLITEAQNIDDTYEELYRSRDSEKTIYDFVISECDDIINDLPETWPSADYGRPTKDAVMALKNRTALFAGSIAQFGTQQLNGLLGFPSTDAQGYYQKSYDAAKSIMDRGITHLYNKYPDDPVKNFRELFLEDKNPEVIWCRQYGGPPQNLWILDFHQGPGPNAWGGSGLNNPYLEMVDAFENVITGTPGQPAPLDRDVIEQGLWSGPDLFEGKEPRFWASIYYVGMPWKGRIHMPYRGLILPNGTIQETGSYEGVLAHTEPDFAWDRGGFGVLKYVSESVSVVGTARSTPTDWKIFRYGEVLLNFAEAAFELGKTDEALNAVNQIRDRAGVTQLTTLDRENIRHERKVELAFEGRRYWDLRRWRTAVTALTGHFTGLRYLKDYETGKFKVQVVEKIDGDTRIPTFYERNYYLPITVGRIGNNPNLVENPDY